MRDGVIDDVRRGLQPLESGPHAYDELLRRIGDARIVLLGEASHGTHEFYAERAHITRRLIAECGFHAVAAEADWPDALRIDRFVRGRGGDPDADAALDGFMRFPSWMWRNTDVRTFVAWLRAHALQRPDATAGFYGLDLYSLHASMAQVVSYLDGVDPEAAARARERYRCFDSREPTGEAYGAGAAGGWIEPCDQLVIDQLVDLRRPGVERLCPDSHVAQDERFHAEQNARVAVHAEEYYRTMFRGGASSWNLRDGHMMETLEALLAHLDGRVGRAKIVVWAHNSHLGDARATDLARSGELNLGQLVRERFGEEAFAVGFSTYEGTVTAAPGWDRAPRTMHVRPGLPGSYEELFHATGVPRFMLALRDEGPTRDALAEERLQRAIGVVYRPQTERVSHYLHARLPAQFDALLHFDRTTAVEPLDGASLTSPGREPPETYPSSL